MTDFSKEITDTSRQRCIIFKILEEKKTEKEEIIITSKSVLQQLNWKLDVVECICNPSYFAG